jgi:hypothetical protein
MELDRARRGFLPRGLYQRSMCVIAQCQISLRFCYSNPLLTDMNHPCFFFFFFFFFFDVTLELALPVQTHETGRVTFSVTPSLMPALIETPSVIFDERIDRGFTLDGIPYFNFQKTQNETQYTLPAFHPLSIPLALGLCYQQPLGFHFDHWFWDPQLAVLLAPMPDQPQSPPARKSTNRIAIAAGVTVAVVIIGSIAIAVGCTLYKKHLWNNRRTTK